MTATAFFLGGVSVWTCSGVCCGCFGVGVTLAGSVRGSGAKAVGGTAESAVTGLEVGVGGRVCSTAGRTVGRSVDGSVAGTSKIEGDVAGAGVGDVGFEEASDTVCGVVGAAGFCAF